MNEVDADTVVVVTSDGVDYAYDKKSHPGMAVYVMPGLRPGRATLWITIPLGESTDDERAT